MDYYALLDIIVMVGDAIFTHLRNVFFKFVLSTFNYL